ncbi:hypothetical protein HDU67_007903 [Dinochytrium kinnereticum]|nr:hypothetical protein HDU67_007903 [Dinochytrium kinnereticum]
MSTPFSTRSTISLHRTYGDLHVPSPGVGRGDEGGGRSKSEERGSMRWGGGGEERWEIVEEEE